MLILCALILLVVCTILISIWYNHEGNKNFWKHQNVELVNFRSFLRNAKGKNFGLAIADIYHEMCKSRSACQAIEVPFFSAVIVRDQQMIKDVLQIHFESFPDRGLYVNFRDSLSMALPRLDYDFWKPLRQKLSPIFTPAQTKATFPSVLNLGESLVSLLNQECGKDLRCELDMYDVCARFTSDLMVQLIFGIDGKSLKEPHNEFRMYGDRAFVQFSNPWRNIIGMKYPRLMRLLNVHVFDRESNEFFTQVFKDCVEYRQQNDLVQHDILNFLINLKRKSEKSAYNAITWEVLVGQAYALFVGGFDTTSCALAYALYELAKNSEMQEIARQEVLSVLPKYDQQLTYEALRHMTYLNQIGMESLRKYPVISFLPRICRRTCTVSTSNGSVTIKPGTFVIIPTYGIHHNPDYYPEPEQFRPEHFAEADTSKCSNSPFLTFGDGPKVCMGELHGKMQVTLGLAILLSHFRLSLCAKTPRELEFDESNHLLLVPKGGVPLRVEKL